MMRIRESFSVNPNQQKGASVMEDTSESWPRVGDREEHLAELNRERVNRHREKVKGNGLVRVEVHIKPEFREQLLVYAKELR